MTLPGARLVLGALVGLAAACTPSAGADPSLAEAFARFPPCEPPAGSGVVVEDVEGLVLPEDAVITATSRSGPVTDVAAYVPHTPPAVRALYEAQDEAEILQIEDETFETEVLVADGDFRTYVIARVACREGSTITAFVAPAGAVSTIPTPSGGAAPRHPPG